ncbi:MAG: hypothetical protein K1X61_10335 [Chitinophagales bacterium]|nr:hypothetical protein [Chitinophagales bacterium]
MVDRGYRGPKTTNETNICVPKPDNKLTKTKRRRNGRIAAIEPVIGHLKSDYRTGKNFLKGVMHDEINVLPAAAAMNFKRVMNLWLKEATNSWQFACNFNATVYRFQITRQLKSTF